MYHSVSVQGQITGTSLSMEDISIYEQRNISLICICISLFIDKGNFVHGGWLHFWTKGISSLAWNTFITSYDKPFLYMEGCSISVFIFSCPMNHFVSVHEQRLRLLNTGNILPLTVFVFGHPKYCNISAHGGLLHLWTKEYSPCLYLYFIIQWKRQFHPWRVAPLLNNGNTFPCMQFHYDIPW